MNDTSIKEAERPKAANTSTKVAAIVAAAQALNPGESTSVVTFDPTDVETALVYHRVTIARHQGKTPSYKVSFEHMRPSEGRWFSGGSVRDELAESYWFERTATAEELPYVVGFFVSESEQFASRCREDQEIDAKGEPTEDDRINAELFPEGVPVPSFVVDEAGDVDLYKILDLPEGECYSRIVMNSSEALGDGADDVFTLMLVVYRQNDGAWLFQMFDFDCEAHYVGNVQSFTPLRMDESKPGIHEDPGFREVALTEAEVGVLLAKVRGIAAENYQAVYTDRYHLSGMVDRDSESAESSEDEERARFEAWYTAHQIECGHEMLDTVFDRPDNGDPYYNGPVHHCFEAWKASKTEAGK